jgi:hypothetical protein
MRTSSRQRRHQRARCTANRSLRSAALAVAVVTLPHIIHFFERGEIDSASLKRLGLGVVVALQMTLYNYLQKLREQPQSNRGRAQVRRRHQESGEEEKRQPEP